MKAGAARARREEAGVLATELIQRGRGKRILVVTQKSMLTQFQKEWWSRFSIPLVRLDSVGLQRVRNQIPTNHNPFNFDRSIISMDTLKTNLEYRNYLSLAWWDIIVIDSNTWLQELVDGQITRKGSKPNGRESAPAALRRSNRGGSGEA